jgi:GNAT superfamily N-acetyltransferase
MIEKIELPAPGIENLLSEALREGYGFVETLVQEWASAQNRFDAPGEVLCGHFDQGQLVAVGALSTDPFTLSQDIGRIRKVYVMPAWRNKGIGRTLVSTLVERARNRFRCVRLRAENPEAARLYESLGFAPIADPDATHILFFGAPDAQP